MSVCPPPSEYFTKPVDVIPGRPTWQQAMLRIKDPEKSLKFYCDLLGFTLLDTFDFPQYNFSLYFVTTLPDGETYNLKPGTQAAHDHLWTMEDVVLELTHNHGTENDPDQKYHPGNEEKDGFGHISVNVADINAACAKLEAAGYQFKQKPVEGGMKMAYAYDPDGYTIQIGQRFPQNASIQREFSFSQTMLRVKDPAKSIEFYRKLGMQYLTEVHLSDFSLYFLATSSCDLANADPRAKYIPALELTHNHGTEKEESFKHFNGNEEGRQGFGHLGFLVDDVYAACDAIRPMGYGFRKEPDEGTMKGLAFAYDPDGYSVEIIKRGGIDFGDKLKD